VILLIVQSPEGALNQSGQLISSAIDGLVHTRGLMRNRNGLVAFEAGFHNAALVILAALVAVLIGQVDFHPRDMITESD